MEPNDELREKVEYYKRMGHQVPKWKYVKTPEQIEGIRASGVINTGVLDYVSERIREGVTTQEIDDWVAEYTEAHDAICAPYHYEGFF